MFKLNKEKYLTIARAQGAQVALTALHRDMNQWEIETFEGEKGWQPQMFEDLKSVRDFSRELWEMAIDASAPQAAAKH
ncbi:MAG: hypothetical protein ACXWPM_07010 [Bdellovibrionota bacterium]